MVHRTAALDARTTSETLEGAVICTGVNPNSYDISRTQAETKILRDCGTWPTFPAMRDSFDLDLY
jgi:hypothetical protein